ncbi:MAG: bifunctional lysylphosphatidylglycerol flippase/synthetase MprF [Rivularia sp. (in: Bacteria)]|nr:bifunctional lysylphosphatidylglycerol flippase/synthetase MprF [Rivularia sp. MS3]
MLLDKRQRVGLWIASTLTALVGIINLLSAVTPNIPKRTELLEQFVPFEIRASSHFLAAITGFILITLAANLLRRKRVAWLLTVGLLIVSITLHLLKGLDYEESLLAVVLLVQLIFLRGLFTAQSDRPSIAQGIRVLIVALLFTLAYGTVGFFLLDKQYSVNFNLFEALQQTFAMFFTLDNAGLQPTTKYGRFFADSIYFVGATTLTYALFMLLRPVLLRTTFEMERQYVKEIVEQYGKSSLARLTLLNDKAYYFSDTGKSVIAYVAKGRGAVALGDPIGPEEDRKNAIKGFQAFCNQNDWYPSFYQTLSADIDLYKSLGFKLIKIGEEAIVDLKSFTVEGKAGKNLRTAINRFTKLNHQVKFYQPPISDELLQKLKIVSDEWLKMMQGSEKRFSVGWFDEDYLRDCEIAVVETNDGEISAFANIIPEYQLNEITIDLMRRKIEVEHGTMDFLFISMFKHFKEKGYDGFNLGLSALSGVGENQEAPKLEKGLHYLYEHLNRFYNFQGLHGFKEKFKPRWEPRYLVYPNLTSLPDVIIALIRADSGDRVLDYFKSGT